MMRTFETPYVADWFAVSVRWTVLVGLFASLGMKDQLVSVSVWPLLLIILWNILLSILAGLSMRLARYHRWVVLGIDFVLAAILFWTQGGLTSPVVWVGLLPILTGAVYFEFPGAMGTGVAFAVLQYLISRDLFFNGFLIAASSRVLMTVLFGLLGGLAGHFVMWRLRTVRQFRLDREERMRHMESERLRAIYELTSTLTATLSYKRVLDSALDLGYNALNPTADPDEPSVDERLVSAVLLFRGEELQIGSARRFTNADMRASLQGKEGILKKVLDDGEAVLTQDIGYDPELGRIIALRSCTTAYCFPLRSGFNIYGAMLFAHPDPGYFTKERCGLLDIIGRQSVIAVLNVAKSA